MNLSVFTLLSLDDLKAFSAVDQLCRQLALPTLFKVRSSRLISNHSLHTNSLRTTPSPSSWTATKLWNRSSLDFRPDPVSAFDHSMFRRGQTNWNSNTLPLRLRPTS